MASPRLNYAGIMGETALVISIGGMRAGKIRILIASYLFRLGAWVLGVGSTEIKETG